MSENPITVKTALEICHHEAVIRRAYKDSVGKWTWSVGLTDATGHGVERYIDNPQPMQHCLSIFIWALESYAHTVRKAFTVELTEEEFAGALSFHWNTGHIHDAEWVKEFNEGNPIEARVSIMNWSSPPEIIPRREAERDLIFDGVWANTGKTTEYTRVTSSYSPDWSSAIRVDIAADIEAILAKTETNPPKENSTITMTELNKELVVRGIENIKIVKS